MKTGNINVYNLGPTLKALRIKRGLSTHQLSKLTGISQSSISCYENNSKVPNAGVLLELADFYNVSTDFLLGRDETYKMDYSNIFENIVSLDNVPKEHRKALIDLIKHFEIQDIENDKE